MHASVQRQIMVIEDSVVVRELLTHIMANEGYEVIGFSDAIEALHYMESAPPPQLILLDMVLPYMGADQFLQARAQQPGFCDVPVAIISSYSREEAQISLAGTVAYLQKPIDLSLLMTTVQRFCP